jgi:PAS domain S-box-containing protein
MSDTSGLNSHAVVLADRSGRIQYWSPGAEALFGYPAQEAVGQTLDLIVPPALREQHWNGFRRAIESGSAAAEGTAFDLPVQCRNGEQTEFPATFVLVRDGAKTVIGAMAIMTAPV